MHSLLTNKSTHLDYIDILASQLSSTFNLEWDQVYIGDKTALSSIEEIQSDPLLSQSKEHGETTLSTNKETWSTITDLTAMACHDNMVSTFSPSDPMDLFALQLSSPSTHEWDEASNHDKNSNNSIKDVCPVDTHSDDSKHMMPPLDTSILSVEPSLC